jgi:hypothetical protein
MRPFRFAVTLATVVAATSVIAFWWWWKAEFKVAVEVLAMMGEWGVVYVIYREIGGARELLREEESGRALTAALELLGEYSSPSMTNAMRELFRWQEDHPKDFAERFVEELGKRTAEGDRLDDHRRFAYRYFHKVRVLSEAELINPKVIELSLHDNPRCFRFLQYVLRPIDEAHTKSRHGFPHDAETFDYYRSRYIGIKVEK